MADLHSYVTKIIRWIFTPKNFGHKIQVRMLESINQSIDQSMKHRLGQLIKAEVTDQLKDPSMKQTIKSIKRGNQYYRQWLKERDYSKFRQFSKLFFWKERFSHAKPSMKTQRLPFEQYEQSFSRIKKLLECRFKLNRTKSRRVLRSKMSFQSCNLGFNRCTIPMWT